jgi:predicted GIY-YIG superfamily endonuclease
MPQGLIDKIPPDTYTVYMLLDEESKCYVGSTINLEKRLGEHRTPGCRRLNKMKGNIHHLELASGISNKHEARIVESEWINKMPSSKIVNTQDPYPIYTKNKKMRNKFYKTARGKAQQRLYNQRYYHKNTEFGKLCSLFGAIPAF